MSEDPQRTVEMKEVSASERASHVARVRGEIQSYIQGVLRSREEEKMAIENVDHPLERIEKRVNEEFYCDEMKQYIEDQTTKVILGMYSLWVGDPCHPNNVSPETDDDEYYRDHIYGYSTVYEDFEN